MKISARDIVAGTNVYLHDTVIRYYHLISNFYDHEVELPLSSYLTSENQIENIFKHIVKEMKSSNLYRFIHSVLGTDDYTWKDNIPKYLSDSVKDCPALMWTYIIGGQSSNYVAMKLLLHSNNLDFIVCSVAAVSSRSPTLVHDVINVIWPAIIHDHIIRWIPNITIAQSIYDHYRIVGIKEWDLETIISDSTHSRCRGFVYYGMIAAPFIRPCEWLNLLNGPLKSVLSEDVVVWYIRKNSHYYETSASLEEWIDAIETTSRNFYDNATIYLMKLKKYEMLSPNIHVKSLTLVQYLYTSGRLKSTSIATITQERYKYLTSAALGFLIDHGIVTTRDVSTLCRLCISDNYNIDALRGLLEHPLIISAVNSIKINTVGIVRIIPPLESLIEYAILSGREYDEIARLYIKGGSYINDPRLIIGAINAQKFATVLAILEGNVDPILDRKEWDVAILNAAISYDNVPVILKLIEKNVYTKKTLRCMRDYTDKRYKCHKYLERAAECNTRK